jgi:hypothetical protein
LTIALACIARSAQAQISEFDQGFRPFGSYNLSEIDSVNLSNGRLLVDIPILSYPQRGALTLTFSLRYTLANPWYVYEWSTGNPPQLHRQWRTTGTGIGISIAWDGNYSAAPLSSGTPSSYFRDPSGALHTTGYVGVYPAASTLESNDGTGFQMKAVNGSYVLTDSHGIQRSSTATGSSSQGYTNTLTATDPNGNHISYVWQTPPGLPGLFTEQWTDTVGRQISDSSQTTTLNGQTFGGWGNSITTTDLSNCPTGTAYATTWTVPAYNNGTATYKFCYATFTITSNFGISYIQEGTATKSALIAIALPNHTSWDFAYSSQGYLSQVTTPAGGTITYGILVDSPCDGSLPADFAVSRRTLSSAGGSSSWTYQRTFLGSTQSLRTTVTDPNNNDTLHDFTSLVSRGCED